LLSKGAPFFSGEIFRRSATVGLSLSLYRREPERESPRFDSSVGPRFDASMAELTRQKKITLGEMRAAGVRGLLI